jgi:hypothetical protein
MAAIILMRLPWENHVLEWKKVDGVQRAVKSSTQGDNDAPWAIWEIDEVILNAEVSARMAKFGD